jgi:hypothetical protein
MMRFVRGFLRFWYDFVVGEDWKIAAGVVATLAGGAALSAGELVSDGTLAVLVSGAIVLVVAASVVGGTLLRPDEQVDR